MDTVREGMIFMYLSLLFGVFDEILKCPKCDGKMDSHVDMRKKNGYSNCNVRVKNVDGNTILTHPRSKAVPMKLM